MLHQEDRVFTMKSKDKKEKRKPKLKVVINFPEERIARNKSFDALIKKLKKDRSRIENSPIVILALEDDKYLWSTNNGYNRKDYLWLTELARLDILGLLEEEDVPNE